MEPRTSWSQQWILYGLKEQQSTSQPISTDTLQRVQLCACEDTVTWAQNAHQWRFSGEQHFPIQGLGDKAKGFALVTDMSLPDLLLLWFRSSSVSACSASPESARAGHAHIRGFQVWPQPWLSLSHRESIHVPSSSEMVPNYCKLLTRSNECLTNALNEFLNKNMDMTWSSRDPLSTKEMDGALGFSLVNEGKLRLHGLWNQAAMGSNPSLDTFCITLGKVLNFSRL